MILEVVDQRGSERHLVLEDGQTVMDAIRGAGMNISAQCGGCCSCATCHVYVDARWMDRVDPATDEEQEMLELAEGAMPCSRLSCQLKGRANLSGLRVQLAPGTEL
jgi:ferredoxin, 2Fe-2S